MYIQIFDLWTRLLPSTQQRVKAVHGLSLMTMITRRICSLIRYCIALL